MIGRALTAPILVGAPDVSGKVRRQLASSGSMPTRATSILLLAAALVAGATGGVRADEGRIVSAHAIAPAPADTAPAGAAPADAAPTGAVAPAAASEAPATAPAAPALRAPVGASAVDAPAPEATAAPSPNARAAASGGVTISGFAFHPSALTVHVGDTISWTNDDSASHTATADDGSFDTGTLERGRSGSHTFTRAGTFAYHCTIHPSMHGTVTVLAAASGSAPAGGSTGAPAPGATAPAAPAASAPTLPNTGVDALGLALAGLGLLVAGLALRRVATR